MADPPEIDYSPHEQSRIEAIVENEIATGSLKPENREHRVRELKREESIGFHDFLAKEESTREINVPGEREVIEVLLSPDATPERIREVCKEAAMSRTVQVEPGVFKEIDGFPAWPLPAGSVFSTYLSQYAEQYVAALHDPRFPRCDPSTRPTTRLKQFWFLSRALAGALFGVSTRTAINLVGSLRPEETFQESRAAKPQRIRRTIRGR